MTLAEQVHQILRDRLVELETMIADGKEQLDTRASLEAVKYLLAMREKIVNRPAPKHYGKPARRWPTLIGPARNGGMRD